MPDNTYKLFLQLARKLGVRKLYGRLIRFKGFSYLSLRDVGEFAIGEQTPSAEQLALLAKVLPKIKKSLEAAERKAWESLPPPENG